MKETDAVALLRQLLKHSSVNDLEEAVFRFAWRGLSYPQISKRLGYDPGYIRGVGFQVWRNLSEACGERVTKKNVKSVFAQHLEQNSPQGGLSSLTLATSANAQPLSYGWKAYPGAPSLYGRESELEIFQRWILEDHSRCISLVGPAGIGKTAIAAYLAQQLQGYFQTVLWYSLHNAPDLNQCLANMIKDICCAPDTTTGPPTASDGLMTELLHLLTEQRCLIILDNAETVLSQEAYAEANRSEELSYLDCLARLNTTPHQSCVLVTNRQGPVKRDPGRMDEPPIRTLEVGGLSSRSGQALVETHGAFWGKPEDWQHLVERCDGNPLALGIAGTVIQSRFGGELALFLEKWDFGFGGISGLLEQQFRELSNLDRHIMYRLAIERQPSTLEALASAMEPPCTHQDIFLVLKGLHERALICKQATRFAQHPVVMEFSLAQFIEQVIQACIESLLYYLIYFPLVKSSAEEALRERQLRIIVLPVLEGLVQQLGHPNRIHKKLSEIRAKLQELSPQRAGYGMKNLDYLAHGMSLLNPGPTHEKNHCSPG
jgi:hypothetical protein